MLRIPSEHDRELLAHLAAHPAWEALREVAKERMDDVFAKTARELMQGAEITREVIEYRRGFFAGIKFLLDQPTLEAKALEKALAEEREEVTSVD